ncbi:MAG: hypothetical protein ACETV1_07955 [Candidatus Bathyarchaeia archaeon]
MTSTISVRIDEEIKREFMEKASNPSEVLRNLIYDYLGLPRDTGKIQSIDKQFDLQTCDRKIRVLTQILSEILDILDAISEDKADIKERVNDLRLML